MQFSFSVASIPAQTQTFTVTLPCGCVQHITFARVDALGRADVTLHDSWTFRMDRCRTCGDAYRDAVATIRVTSEESKA